MFFNQLTKGNTMEEEKQFYSTQSRLVVANAYASQIMSDVSEKISTGCECRTITEFYKQCSQEELDEVTDWNHGVFGKALCDSIDKIIDDALLSAGLAICEISSIRIEETFHVTRELNKSIRVTTIFLVSLCPEVKFFYECTYRNGKNASKNETEFTIY